MIEEHRHKGSRRLLAKIAITGALTTVPMAVVAVPAFADPAPGVAQADQDWQYSQGRNDRGDNRDRDNRDRDNRGDNRGQNQGFGSNFPGGSGWPGQILGLGGNPFSGLFGGIFGSS